MAESRPTVLPEAQVTPREEARVVRKFSIWRGLIWAEWYSHSRFLLLFLGLWLASVWTLPFFTHPLWIVALGWVYAMVAGPAYGGIEILDGSEEFVHTLPPRRVERYLARLLVGGGTVLLFALMNWGALDLDLPQILHRLYVKSGLVKRMPHFEPAVFLALVVFAPLGVFTFSFLLASLTHARLMILTAWFWGVLGVLALVETGFFFEEWTSDGLAGSAPCWFLAGGIVVAAVGGYQRVKWKEIGERGTPLAIPGYWWLWCALGAVGFGLAALLLGGLARHSQLLRW